MTHIIDIVLILFYALLIGAAAKRGLVKSVVDMFGSILSLVAATFIAGLCCQWIYDNFIRDMIINSMMNTLPADLRSLSGSTASSLVTYLPDKYVSVINSFGLEHLLDGIRLPDIGLTVTNIETTYIAPVVVKLVKIAVTAVIYFVFRLIVRILTVFLKDVIRKTFLKKIDIGLGAVFGSVKGILSVGIISVILVLVSSLIPSSQIAELINNSKICSLFAEAAQGLVSIGG